MELTEYIVCHNCEMDLFVKHCIFEYEAIDFVEYLINGDEAIEINGVMK